MGTDRTASTAGQAAALPIPRSQTGGPSGGAYRNCVCPAHGDSLGGFTQRNGMRVRDDVLEATARLAGRRSVGRHPPDVAQQTARCGQARLVPDGRGQFQRSRRFWEDQIGPNPTDRSKSGTKHHILVDGQGTPMAKTITGANAADITQLIPLVDAIPPVTGKPGRPRRRPQSLWADKAYDSIAHRLALWERGIDPVIPKRGTGRAEGLGPVRWVVERTISWLHQLRRLRVRYERRGDIHEAFLTIGCILICHRALQRSLC